MITSTSVTHAPEIETRASHTMRGSVEKVRNSDSSLLVPGPLSGNSGERRGTGVGNVPRQSSLDPTRKNIHLDSQSLRTRNLAVDNSFQSNHHIPSTDDRSLLDEVGDVENRYLEESPGEANNSSFLYAEFSKNPQPRRHRSPDGDSDYGATHRILRQSLASIYPSEVVEYVSLRQVTNLCENHIILLHKRPSIQICALGKMRHTSHVDDGTPASARSTIIDLRNRLIELRRAIKVSRQQCIQAGYSLSELDILLFPPGSGSYVSDNRTPPIPKTDDEDDSSSVYSEDFHSTTE